MYTPLLTYAKAVKKSCAPPSMPCTPPTMPCAMHYAPRHDTPCPTLSTSSATLSDHSTISRRYHSKRCHKCCTLRHIRQECPNWHKSHRYWVRQSLSHSPLLTKCTILFGLPLCSSIAPSFTLVSPN
jgi:hypothetical protein